MLKLLSKPNWRSIQVLKKTNAAYLQNIKFTRAYSTQSNDSLSTILSGLNPTIEESYKDVIKSHHHNITANGQPQENATDQLLDLTSSLIKTLQQQETDVLNVAAQAEILNLLLIKYTKFNYAVATLTIRQLEKLGHKPSLEALTEMIKYNPGRVSSSWELYHDLSKGLSEGDDAKQLHLTVLNKLIYGDSIEVRDGREKIDLDRAVRIFQVCRTLQENSKSGEHSAFNDLSEESIKKLVDDFLDLELTKVIGALGLPLNGKLVVEVLSEREEAAAMSEKMPLKNSDYLHLLNALVSNAGEEAHAFDELLISCLSPVAKLQTGNLKNSDNFDTFVSQLPKSFELLSTKSVSPSPVDLTAKIMKRIEELKLDTDSQALRLSMLKAAGFYSLNLEKTIELFQRYQLEVPQDSAALNAIQSTASLIFAYHAILNNPSLIDFAQVLIPQSPFPPAANMASVVLYHAWSGDEDKALDTYNKSLDIYMEPKDDSANEKSRGVLVESLIMGALVSGDLELAQFVKTKVKENKLINDLYEVRLGEILKSYGDLVESSEGDKDKLREGLKKSVLKLIRDFAP
ncbi:unnamed protein product [Ambrosiozyma monospora]|uniref:Unnamed protein product n=1 Tax=Ambrosiozyma monospora TaxID=43982 RepID=A0A9W6YZM0_AMBMO|nr:unnamed protein product [Ambrosiozyma monospora]